MVKERVIRSPGAGVFTTHKRIGDTVLAGEVIGRIKDLPLKASLSGMLRSLIGSRIKVERGAKLTEVDHIHDSITCNYVTDKALKTGGGVLRSIKLKFSNENKEATEVE